MGVGPSQSCPAAGTLGEFLGCTYLPTAARGGSPAISLGTGQGPSDTTCPMKRLSASCPALGLTFPRILCSVPKGWISQTAAGRGGALGARGVTGPSEASLTPASVSAWAGQRSSHQEPEFPPSPARECPGPGRGGQQRCPRTVLGTGPPSPGLRDLIYGCS